MTNPEQPLLFSGGLIRKIFDSLSAHIAILDETGAILETNAAWKRFAVAGGVDEQFDFRRMNYLHICETAKGKDAGDAEQVARGIRGVMAGTLPEFLYGYPCHSPRGKRWFYMRAVPMADRGPLRVIISHEDITELKLAQEELGDKNQSLEEANIALKVLIRHREKDRAELEKKIVSHIKTLVLPYMDRIEENGPSPRNRTLLTIARGHLNDILSPMTRTLSHAGLTPQETQVAALVRDGKTSAEIADILFISEATVSFHRKNLRAKLGLTNRRANLRAHLSSIS